MKSTYQTKDFWAGCVYVAIGLAAILIAQDYKMGTAARMGAGYFPRVLSGLLMLIGLASILRAFLQPGERVERIQLRPMLLIVGSTLIFAASVRYLGTVIAVPLMGLLAASASRMFRITVPALVGLALLTAFCTIVFQMGLGVPLPILGSLFGG
ncbi:tripartite tricarboxylate transporter TctB family protein [Paracoccus litorisediminis]|uniref:Tripartite tricarboxylate transporter TctB family protein n=1 Tax=Paracoccus litorisediminis TaxID=2006130 RepID=A0A844HPS6_9RHOB|nr:tripartite tricarboxylate transporter TctB family protein [Paracoccus litorisediminis]MTH60357.1 tripartite tricarboxylate transporter TctB family protein [Paracoccus litorisediminis]